MEAQEKFVSDKPDPFEVLAADVQSHRQHVNDIARQLNADRQTVGQTWQRQIYDVLYRAGQRMAFIQVTFGQVELIIVKDELIGLRYPVYGLSKNANLLIQVDKPYIAQVRISTEQFTKEVWVSPIFPTSEFSDAVAAVLRAALL